MAEPLVHPIYEPKTGTWQYVVADPETRQAVVIDSVLDFDPCTSSIATTSADGILDLVGEHQYDVVAILETHVHADHLTAAKYLQHALEQRGQPRADICIGKRIEQVQRRAAGMYGIAEAEYAGAFDRCLEDDETVAIGRLGARVFHLPGHTPDHVGYHVGANVFTGDSIFPPDVGSARCDFPGGDATALYRSMTRLLALPPATRLYSGHDYPPGADAGRAAPRAFGTVAEHRAANKHVRDGVPEPDFVKWRAERDAGLAEPKLIHQALQFNIRGGRLPAPNAAGIRFLHVPLKLSVRAWE